MNLILSRGLKLNLKSHQAASSSMFSRVQGEGRKSVFKFVVSSACSYTWGALCFPRAEGGMTITVLLGCESLCVGHTTKPFCWGWGLPPPQLSRGPLCPLIPVPQPQPVDEGHRVPLLNTPSCLPLLSFPLTFLLCPQTGNRSSYLDDKPYTSSFI